MLGRISAGGDVIRRFFDAQAAQVAPATQATPTVLPPHQSHQPATPQVVDADPDRPPSQIRPDMSAHEWAQLVDEVTRRIEGRITAELARRGRRLPRTW